MYVQDEDQPDHMVFPNALRHTNTMAIRRYSNLIFGNIIDVGSDHSIYTLIASHSESVTSAIGVDIFPKSIDKFNRLKEYHPESVSKKVSMVCCNVLDLDKHFSENSFDCLLSFHMLEHIYQEDLDLAMVQMKRILKPNNHFIISIPWEENHNSGNHETFWNDVSLVKLFDKHNFEVYECFREVNNHLTGAFKNVK